jgi:hypothetical protein
VILLVKCPLFSFFELGEFVPGEHFYLHVARHDWCSVRHDCFSFGKRAMKILDSASNDTHL